MARLMSEVHLLMKLIFELLFLWVGPLGCRLQAVVVLLALVLEWGLYMSRSPGLHNLYTHNFSIIDVLWFLLLKRGC